MSDQPQYPSYPGDDDQPSEPAAAPPPSYGQAPPAYGQAPPAYGQVPPGYGQAPPGYDQPPSGYGPPPGFGPPPGYGQAPQGYGYPPRPQNSTKAVLGMVLGIVSIVFCYLGVLIGPAAIIVSAMARKEIDAAPKGAYEGRGMAIAGLVTGIVGTVIWAGFIAVVVITTFA